MVGDAAMVKDSSRRRPCAHWEVLRDFFQISAMYIVLIEYALPDPACVVAGSSSVHTEHHLHRMGGAGQQRRAPFMGVRGSLMLIGVLLRTSLT